MWDPAQYGRYSDERARPYFDLVDRVPTRRPAQIVDLGCGPGTLTATLAARWPEATIVGIDSSLEMIAAAAPLAGQRLRFELGDIATWEPAPGLDLIVSNAALQWVPGHERLFDGWIEALGPGGSLAFQVPGNFSSPSHTILADLRDSPRWNASLRGGLSSRPVRDAVEYLARLSALGCVVDAWETTYIHLLRGEDPVLEWLKGTALRPYLAQLEGPDREEFLSEFGRRLRDAYPASAFGTALPFRRIFVVASKPL